MASKIQFVKDVQNRKITVVREFDGTQDQLWEAWTESKWLDQWWAPKPWKAETKSMDFRTGGRWLYSMVGPEQQRHWCRVDYKKVDPKKSFEGADCFCDEQGNASPDMPKMDWRTAFAVSSVGTIVTVNISFATEAALRQITEMGFEAGFTAALDNLDQYLEARFKLRTELKTGNAPRVVTYLNFPGTTEQAFLFYRSVFKTEFSGKGIQRFGDIPATSGHPPVPDLIKKMILHVELPILGGHILMATDAPKEMGMNLSQGNNMHICLEPATRVETKRLFDALSAGGSVTMPLADMFFGAYFGECTDKFGINWMFNCVEKP